MEDNSIGMNESLKIEGPNGKLHIELQMPIIKPGFKTPLVILMHGLMSNSENPILKMISDKLVANGFSTIRFDFDGLGQSDGKFIDMTIPKEVEDALCVYNFASNLDFVSCISLVGHSMGGLITSIIAGKLGKKITSVVLISPAASIPDDIRSGHLLSEKFDPKELPEFIAIKNFQVGKQFLISAHNIDVFHSAIGYDGPVCIIHGLADTAANPEYSKKYHEFYQGSEINLLEGEDHFYTNDRVTPVEICVKFLIKEDLKRCL